MNETKNDIEYIRFLGWRFHDFCRSLPCRDCRLEPIFNRREDHWLIHSENSDKLANSSAPRPLGGQALNIHTYYKSESLPEYPFCRKILKEFLLVNLG